MRLWPVKRRDARIGDELRFHRDHVIEEYVARGVDRREAERRAFIEFGNVAALEEECRDVRGRWLADLARDVRYTLRTLRRSPLFATVAIVSLALGIGANSAIFSVVNGVMLTALPVPRPEQLIHIGRINMGPGPGRLRFLSYPAFEHLRRQMTSVEGMFAQFPIAQSVVIDGEDDLVAIDAVSGSYFGVLGLRPAAGRFFGPGDDVPSPAGAAAVITHGYWQRRFAGRADAVGSSIVIRARSFTIIGVAPRGYTSAQSGRTADLMVPLLTVLTDNQRTSLGNNFLTVLGRLAPGKSAGEADAEANAFFAGLLRANAAELPADMRAEILRQRAGADSAPGGFNPTRDAVARPLLIVMGIVAVILLLACINVSGLLLARAEARHREVSVRLAIGAGPGRVARQFLTETLVLALVGGAAGLVLARWLGTTLLALFIGGRDVVIPIPLDWRELGFAALTCVVACVLAGMVPALGAFRTPLNPGLKEVRSRGQGRIGKALVTVQIAMSMVLVVGATLFVGTLVRLYAVDRGFQSHGVLVVSVRHQRLYEPDRAAAIQSELLRGLGALPGVRAVSAAQMLPVGGGLWDRSVHVEGQSPRPDEPRVGFNVIAPGYFATLGTRVAAGREFTDRDGRTTPKVAIVNESFARRFFGRNPAIGRRVTSVDTIYEIVGVAADTKYQDLREASLPTLYVAWSQREERDQPSSYNYLVQVTGQEPLRHAPDVERVIQETDAGMRIRRITPYDALINLSIANERVLATLAGLFGTLGLLIAAIGMFGVLAFQVSRRTNELAVRMVLGARRSSIHRLVMRDVAAMLVPGLAIGAAAALMLTGVTGSLLFGVTPDDPGAFATAAAVLASVAVLAGWLPAQRAASVEPMAALRHE